MLAARGLITVRQGQGIMVSPLSDAAFGEALLALLMRSDLTMGDVIDARAALETELAPLAARNGRAEDWAHMDEHFRAFAAAVAERRWERAHEEHMRFHLGIFEALRIPALELLLRPVQQYIFLTSVPPVPDDPSVWEVDSHPPILAALRAGDEPAVRKAMREHFEFVKKREYRRFREAPFQTAAALEPLGILRPSTDSRPGDNAHKATA
jgi:GntR family transcriptional regulator, transcriptional repressor for pyruvate dehydrogenase complex